MLPFSLKSQNIVIFILVRGGEKETCDNRNFFWKMDLQLLRYVGYFEYLIHYDIMHFSPR